MRIIRFIYFQIVISLGFFSTLPIYAQFAYQKIEDYTEFEFEKPVDFYTNPRYNRVEGVFLNFGLKLRPQSVSRLRIFGDAGWGFKNQSDKQFRYTVGIRKDFFELKRLSFGVEAFKKVESEDDWVISDIENSLAAFFLGEDFKDYYGTQGFKLYMDHRFLANHTLRFEVGRRTIDALKRNTKWSVLGDSESFEENPAKKDFAILEGDEVGVTLIAAFDWRDNPIFPLSGWFLEGIYERTFGDFDIDDQDTDGLFLNIKRFQQMFGNQRLLIRGMIGTRRGSLAEQYVMNLGGIGSLRGFDDREFTGNRMVMLNANYLFGGDLLQKIPLERIPVIGGFWTALSLGIFLDTGWAWVTNPDNGLFDGFRQLTVDRLKTNIGLSFLVLDGLLRLDIAKRTERSKDDIRITFRLLEKL